MQTKNLEKTTEKKTTKQSKNNSKERLKKKNNMLYGFQNVFFFLNSRTKKQI